MPTHINRHAEQAARLLVDAFADYNARFADITRRAQRHFEKRDWPAARRDAVARIELYDQIVAETFTRLEQRMGERIFAHALWVSKPGHPLSIVTRGDRSHVLAAALQALA